MANILIVDDENSIRNTFDFFLSKEGYNIFIAEEVSKAIEIIDENNLDLIITDIVMPKISGMEFLKIVKERNRNIPIIIMTGEPTIATAKQAVLDSADDYLIKPVNKETLIKVAKYALEK